MDFNPTLILKGAAWLQPIVREMKGELLAGDYVQVDETPVRMLDPEVQGRCATGYLWVAGRPGEEVVFEFHPGHGKEYGAALIGSFGGYWQRDGYGVYGALARAKPELIPVGCWSHARRKSWWRRWRKDPMKRRETKNWPSVASVIFC